MCVNFADLNAQNKLKALDFRNDAKSVVTKLTESEGESLFEMLSNLLRIF